MEESGEAILKPSRFKVGTEKEITARSLLKASFDTLCLYRKHGGEMTFSGAFILVGMKTAFPEKFGNKELLGDPNFKFFNYLVRLGVVLNDVVDIVPHARSEGQQEVVEKIFERWKKAIEAVNTKAGEFSQEMQQPKKEFIKNYQREFLFLEEVAREKSGADWDFSQVLRYREIMNAASIVHDAAALLGDDVLSPRLALIDKRNLSWEALEEKYDWIIKGRYENQTEQKLCALFNIVMCLQIVDDQLDLEDDWRLGLCTIATQVLKEKEGNNEAVESTMRNLAAGYFKKAEFYGMTRPAGKGMEYAFILAKKLAKKFPHQLGGRRERLLDDLSRFFEFEKKEIAFENSTLGDLQG